MLSDIANVTGQKLRQNWKKKPLRYAKVKRSPGGILNSRLSEHHGKNLNRALNLK